jgi:hypothetical protein
MRLKRKNKREQWELIKNINHEDVSQFVTEDLKSKIAADKAELQRMEFTQRNSA